jgi:hypothetical protein
MVGNRIKSWDGRLPVQQKFVGGLTQRKDLMKKNVFMAMVVLAVCLLAAGCASYPASAFFGPGNFYSDTATVGEKRGEAKSRVFLGLFGTEAYPAVERVARENGIAKIATVEHYAKLGILAIWVDYTTIVTGE